MVEIELYGLTPHQQKIADALWSISDYSDVEQYIDTLSDRDQADARSIIEVMKLAVLEQHYGDIEQYTEALEVINRVK